jgi:hypothetical protein
MSVMGKKRDNAIHEARKALLMERLSGVTTTAECISLWGDLRQNKDEEATNAARRRAIELAETAEEMRMIKQSIHNGQVFSVGVCGDAFFEKAMALCEPKSVHEYSQELRYLSPKLINWLVSNLKEAKELTLLAKRIKHDLGPEGVLGVHSAAERAANLVTDWQGCSFVAELHPRPLPLAFLGAAIVFAEQLDGYWPLLKVCDWIRSSEEFQDPNVQRAGMYAENLHGLKERARAETEKRLRAAYKVSTDSDLPDWAIVARARENFPELASEFAEDMKVKLIEYTNNDFLGGENYTALSLASDMRDAGVSEIWDFVTAHAFEIAKSFDDYMRLLSENASPEVAAEKALRVATCEADVQQVLRSPNFSGDWTVLLCQQIFNDRLKTATSVEDFLILHHLTKDPALLAGVEEKVQMLIAPFVPKDEEEAAEE